MYEDKRAKSVNNLLLFFRLYFEEARTIRRKNRIAFAQSTASAGENISLWETHRFRGAAMLNSVPAEYRLFIKKWARKNGYRKLFEALFPSKVIG